MTTPAAERFYLAGTFSKWKEGVCDLQPHNKPVETLPVIFDSTMAVSLDGCTRH